MQLKKFLLFGLMAAVLPALAEEAADRKTATSLKYVTHELDTRQDKFSAGANKAMEYTNTAGNVQKRTVKPDLGSDTSDTSLPMVGGVNTKLNQKQDDIAPINDHTAVTYTGQSGSIGQKGIYQTTESYVEQSDNLIDAKTFNAALKRGLDSEFVCSEFKPDTDLCWVWSIHNITTPNGALPNGYTPLEYIEFTGSQWIDTGILPSSNMEIQMTLLATRTGDMAYSIAGSNSSSNGMYYHINGGSTGSANMNGRSTFFTTPINEKHTIIQNRNNVTFDGTQYSYTNPVSDFSGTRPIWIGGNNPFSFYGRVFSWRINENGALIQNLVPARRNSDNIAGMYDTVNNRFLTNPANTENFNAGPDIQNSIYIPQNQ